MRRRLFAAAALGGGLLVAAAGYDYWPDGTPRSSSWPDAIPRNPLNRRPQPPWSSRKGPNSILLQVDWPDAFPLTAEHLSVIDKSDDAIFYSAPRYVMHIDAEASAALGRYYRTHVHKGSRVLDIASSWTSHFQEGSGKNKTDGHYAHVSAVGMNHAELSANPALHDFHVIDLNKSPAAQELTSLLAPYADASFDAVICSVSVDYLTQPLEVFREIERVLVPGGKAIMTWSNRMFPTKAIRAWREASEPERLLICGFYFHFAGGFDAPKGEDITAWEFGDMVQTTPRPAHLDPLYAVSAHKALQDKIEL